MPRFILHADLEAFVLPAYAGESSADLVEHGGYQYAHAVSLDSDGLLAPTSAGPQKVALLLTELASN